MVSRKQNYLDQYKELGLRIHQQLKGSVVALCPFHGDKSNPTLLVVEATGEHKCSEQACVASRTGSIDDYCDLIFGKEPKRAAPLNAETVVKRFNASIDDKLSELDRDKIDVELAQIGRAENVGKSIKLRATLSGKDLQPYASPRKIRLTCKMGLKICGACAIGQAQGILSHEITKDSPDVIRMIDIDEDRLKELIRRSVGVYPKCGKFEMKVEEFHTVEDVRLMPEISFSADLNSEYTVKQGYHVGHGIKTNATYAFEGLVLADPKDQHVTMQLTKATPIRDSIESFKMTRELYDQFKIFQVAEEQDIGAKLRDIAIDLSTNVTHIYEREDLVTGIDLIYHSVLYFRFQGKLVNKGWTEALIIGDTRCGKTETVTSLIRHYRAGEISTGENCSFAGLVGGLQQIGSRWAISWGKLPLNDKRLFVIDEVSGMPVEDIGRMSGVRSSGLAEITKVQTERTHARTRIIWVANPRSSRPLGSYDTGVQAVPELMGRPEDIARFDFAIAVMSGDVPLEVVNKAEQPEVEHRYTSELCSKLIMWAWSRKPDDIIITKEAEKLCLTLSMEMGQRYTSLIPLVEPAEFRIKLIRLSVACAARLFSTVTGEDLIVDATHVQAVYDFLNKIYSQPSLNYLAYSKARIIEQSLKDSSVVEVIVKSHGPQLVEGLLGQQYFRLQDFEDLFDMEKKELKGVISQLVRNRAIKHYNTVYVKTPAFITLLRKTQAAGVQEKPKPQEVDY